MDDFIDYYELLQISPNAEPQTVHRVYKMLAARYHPDNPTTGDTEMFMLLQRACQVLSDAEQRAAYDARRQIRGTEPNPVFEMKEFVTGIDAEANRRLGVLCLLYNRRRANPMRPGLSLLDLENIMRIPREHLEFTAWYLRDRKLVRAEDDGEYSITSDGIDFVEARVPSNRIVHKLITGHEFVSGWMGRREGPHKTAPS